MDQMNKYGKTIYINMHPKALLPRLLSSKCSRPLLEGKDEKEMLDYVFKTLQLREKYYHKAKKIIMGYNLTARKLEKNSIIENIDIWKTYTLLMRRLLKHSAFIRAHF